MPDTYLQLQSEWGCFAGKPVSAACMPRIEASSKLETTTTYVGRYPPLYYAIVGLPSIFSTAVITVHLMSLISALLSALFISLALAVARQWSDSPLLPAGVLIAATPTALFFAGAINPSGLEISTAIALWTGAVVLVTDQATSPPVALVAIVAGCASVLALARADTPLWLPVVFVVLAPLWYRRMHLSWLFKWSTLIGGLIVATAVATAGAWIIYAHALRVVPDSIPSNHSLVAAVGTRVGDLSTMIAQEIGIFGWLDTPAPWFTTIAWYLLCGGVITIAIMVGRRRQVLALILVLSAALGTPIVLGVIRFSKDGNIGQGRYFLPLAVGVPIVALGSLRARGSGGSVRRLQLTMGSLIATGQFVAFYMTLRRYRVGPDGPIFGSSGVPPAQIWHAPFGALSLEVAFLIGCVGIVMACLRGTPDRFAQSSSRGP